MTDFKPGDKVRLKTLDELLDTGCAQHGCDIRLRGSRGAFYVTSAMLAALKNKTLVVAAVAGNSLDLFEGDEISGWGFESWMLLPADAPKKPSAPELENTLVCSPAHILKSDMEKLEALAEERIDDIPCFEFNRKDSVEYETLLLVVRRATLTDDKWAITIQQFVSRGFSASMLALLEYARKYKVRWIVFDPAGQEIDELELHNWEDE